MRSAGPPTRKARWCCGDYKEHSDEGRVLLIGARADESPRRALRWGELSRSANNDTAICPIVYWRDCDVWSFLRGRGISYCGLYDEGFKRLGCVGCPLAGDARYKQFARWPKYGERWHAAILANWQRWKDIPNSHTGLPRYQAKFPTGEDFWRWWMTGEHRTTEDVFRDGCQSGLLWTNGEIA